MYGTYSAGLEPSFKRTPIRRVLATVIQSPLLVSNTFLNFSLHPGYLDDEAAPVQHQQVDKSDWQTMLLCSLVRRT